MMRGFSPFDSKKKKDICDRGVPERIEMFHEAWWRAAGSRRQPPHGLTTIYTHVKLTLTITHTYIFWNDFRCTRLPNIYLFLIWGFCFFLVSDDSSEMKIIVPYPSLLRNLWDDCRQGSNSRYSFRRYSEATGPGEITISILWCRAPNVDHDFDYNILASPGAYLTSKWRGDMKEGFKSHPPLFPPLHITHFSPENLVWMEVWKFPILDDKLIVSLQCRL